MTMRKNKRDKDSIPANITIPGELFNDEKLKQAIAYGFNTRSKFVQACMLSIKSFVDIIGVEKGIEEFKKRLEVKR